MSSRIMPMMTTPTVGELRHAITQTRRRQDYPHRDQTDYLAIARRAALSFLVLLIIAALLTALYDIASQVIRSNRSSKISDLAIALGMYVTVIILGSMIMLSRRFIVRNEYASIPKGYMPIQSTDVPKPAFELISNEYDRAAVITHIAQPQHRVQEGWGRPGTPYENVHFRTSILSTIPVLESVVNRLSLSPIKPSHARASTLSPLAPLLRAELLPRAIEPLALLYEQQLQRAQYGDQEPTEKDWDETVKYVAVLVDVLGKVSAAQGHAS